MAATAARRTAQISYGVRGDGREVRVSHPGKLTPAEIARIDKVLINDVIHDLTGCSCLSGTVPVVWEQKYEKILAVDLDLKA